VEISFKCEHCGHGIRIDEDCGGLLMKCVSCLQLLTIPTPKGRQPFPPPDQSVAKDPGSCPFCLEAIRAGRHACNVCGQEFRTVWPRQAHIKQAALKLAGVFAGLAVIVLGFWTSLQPKPPKRIATVPVKAEPVSAAPRLKLQAGSAVAAVDLAPRQETRVEPEPQEQKSAAAKLTVAGEANKAVAQIGDLSSAVKAGIQLELYTQKVAALATTVDELLRIVDESGLYDTNEAVRNLCKRASDIFFDYNQALNHWNVEVSMKADKEAVRAAHQAKLTAPGGEKEMSQSVQDTTDELDELTYRVMRAINDRYDLWVDAQKQEEAIRTLLPNIAK
jgi:hypothetical protein